MKRRRFLAALSGAAVSRPIAAVAQQSAGIPRVGLLMGADPSDEAAKLDAFREALEKLGYIDGQAILIELRYAMGQPDRFGSLARELVALAPAVIACVGRQETAALQAATRTIPIGSPGALCRRRGGGQEPEHRLAARRRHHPDRADRRIRRD
jgi:putative ABC transport system substrate-binding protein